MTSKKEKDINAHVRFQENMIYTDKITAAVFIQNSTQKIINKEVLLCRILKLSVTQKTKKQKIRL